MAVEGKVGWVGPNKRGEGFRVAIGDEWYTVAKRYEGILEKGNKIKAKTKVEDGETYLGSPELIEKAEGGGWKGKGGGGGRKPDPKKEERFEKQAEREAEKWSHQLTVVEPRITYANARDHALRFLDMLVRTESLVLGKDVAKREGILTDKLNELIATFVAGSNTHASGETATADADDGFDDDKSDEDGFDSDDDGDDGFE